MTLREVLDRYRSLIENSISDRAEKAKSKLAKQLHWPNNPPMWLRGIGVEADRRGNYSIVVSVAHGYVKPTLPRQVDGISVIIDQ